MKPKQLEWSLSGHGAFYYSSAFGCEYRLWRRTPHNDSELCCEFWRGEYQYCVVKNGYFPLDEAKTIAQAHHDRLWMERAENEGKKS